MDLSIVIVSFNTGSLLDACLSSIEKTLAHTALTYETIVVENGSTDNTKEMLEAHSKHVRVLWNQENVGFGRANNQAIAKASGTFVLILNSDTVLYPYAVERLVGFARKHAKAFIGAKLLNSDGSPQTSCGPFFSLPVVFAALFLKGDTLGLTRFSPSTARRVDWVSGACIISSRINFLDGLLFDEQIFMYMEEVELLMRAKKKGYQTYYYPHARVMHVGTGSSKGRTQPVTNIYKGILYIYSKHYGPAQRVIVRILLKTKAAGAWCIGMLTGNQSLVSTYGKAYQLV